jgi:hypothetical protein
MRAFCFDKFAFLRHQSYQILSSIINSCNAPTVEQPGPLN